MGADGDCYLLRATWAPTDICIAGLILVDVAVDTAAFKHDPQIFPFGFAAFCGRLVNHFT